jgi:2-polyprenyl-3-methyl-5-hydroxy-6-metoxy-1,4-benzoquinol methylase
LIGSPHELSRVPQIQYLSPPAAVSMADQWYEIASIDHFWILRRFEVFRRLAGRLILAAREIAEIGCGHGLLQLQVEKAYGRQVTGFDLNEFALQQNVSQSSTICCYDIFQKDSSLRGLFDLIFLFDVLEHIADEDRFISAILFHLAPGGRIVVNVPAGQSLYSAYDRAAGHVRRYSIRALRGVAGRSNLEIRDWTYWGLPLLPALILRKFWLMGQRDKDKIISAGFDSRSRFINDLLGRLSGCEPIPQKLAGTSLMAVLQRGRGAC